MTKCRYLVASSLVGLLFIRRNAQGAHYAIRIHGNAYFGCENACGVVLNLAANRSDPLAEVECTSQQLNNVLIRPVSGRRALPGLE